MRELYSHSPTCRCKSNSALNSDFRIRNVNQQFDFAAHREAAVGGDITTSQTEILHGAMSVGGSAMKFCFRSKEVSW